MWWGSVILISMATTALLTPGLEATNDFGVWDDIVCKKAADSTTQRLCGNDGVHCEQSRVLCTSCEPHRDNRPIQRCTNETQANQTCLVSHDLLCEGEFDCPDTSPCDLGCTSTFICPDGSCLHRNTVCDRDSCNDCPSQDSWNNGHGFKCVRNGKLCKLPQVLLYDGTADCDNGTDLCFVGDAELLGYPRDIRNQSKSFNTSLCFLCLDHSTVVSRSSVCDDVIDCPDMSDECLCQDHVPWICRNVVDHTSNARNEFAPDCPNGHVGCGKEGCIKRSQVCDGTIDCNPPIDEDSEFCGGTMSCMNATQPNAPCRCADMPAEFCSQELGVYCDGREDCVVTGSDRATVSANDECSTQCVNTKRKANLTVDCCPSNHTHRNEVFSCQSVPAWNNATHHWCNISSRGDNTNTTTIPAIMECDGHCDCPYGNDENPIHCVAKDRFYCDALDHGVSINVYQLCDYVMNCKDHKDELGCNDGRFYCESHSPLYVKSWKIANGAQDCSDWSDECPHHAKASFENVCSSRTDLLLNVFLQVAVWIMGALALIGNLGVVIEEVRTLMTSRSNNASLRSNKILIINLASADILMGVYLITIGSYAAEYNGTYCANNLYWKSSSSCTALGILVVISCETSVLTMVLLTLARLYAVYRPFKSSYRPTKQVLTFCIALTWGISLLVAFIPLTTRLQAIFARKAWIQSSPFFSQPIIDIKSFQSFAGRLLKFNPANTTLSELQSRTEHVQEATAWKELQEIVNDHYKQEEHVHISGIFGFYSRSSVCIPEIFVTRSDGAWLYSLTLMIFNLATFVFVCCSYALIYFKSSQGEKRLRRNAVRLHSGKSSSKHHQEIQRKVIRLVTTDFCCWVPIALMAFLNFGGVPVPPIAYAVSAIVLLPINSALNPIIYSNLPCQIYQSLLKRGATDERFSDLTSEAKTRAFSVTSERSSSQKSNKVVCKLPQNESTL